MSDEPQTMTAEHAIAESMHMAGMGGDRAARYPQPAEVAAFLAALDAAGWAVVPSIETPEMIHAGRKRLRVLLKGAPDLYTDGEVNDLAMGAYGHMLAARPR